MRDKESAGNYEDTSHFTLTGGNTNSLPLTGYCVKNKKNKKPCVAVTELAQ